MLKSEHLRRHRTDKAQAPPTRKTNQPTPIMPHTPKPETTEDQTAEAVGLAALCSASDLLERAHDMLSRAHIMLDGWPQAVQWHHDYERLKKQWSWKDHSTATYWLNS